MHTFGLSPAVHGAVGAFPDVTLSDRQLDAGSPLGHWGWPGTHGTVNNTTDPREKMLKWEPLFPIVSVHSPHWMVQIRKY